MSVIKVNKSQLTTATLELMSKVTDVNSTFTDLNNVLKSIPSHSEFGNLVSKATMIASSMEGIYTDLEHVTKNMNTGKYLESTNSLILPIILFCVIALIIYLKS